jgi:hypothetical protein
MRDVHEDWVADFPRHGARARLIARFERDLREWLDSAEGRFAVWQAREPSRSRAVLGLAGERGRYRDEVSGSDRRDIR